MVVYTDASWQPAKRRSRRSGVLLAIDAELVVEHEHVEHVPKALDHSTGDLDGVGRAAVVEYLTVLGDEVCVGPRQIHRFDTREFDLRQL